MAQGTKTDNACPDVKLALRRYMLDRYHVGEPIRVLDCCQGSGVLWGTLQQEYDLAGYWGVDVKHKPGRLKLDSSRILARPGWRENVIDIDTYGSPWKHWTNLIKTIDHPTTVFLTIGQVNIGTDLNILRVLGLHKLRTRPPQAALCKLADMALSYYLTSGCDDDIIPLEVAEATDGLRHTARYVAVRLDTPDRGQA